VEKMHDERSIAIKETVIIVIIFFGLSNKIPMNTNRSGKSLRFKENGW
jgi:hypothetical protein